MHRTPLAIATVVIVASLLSGCGWFDRVTAIATGWSRICIDGVSYIQFASGASVEYTRDCKVKTCD